ncbi:MAG: hypothetical protein GF408_01950 [Candidatus Omnitrophica bacterium]|nr:hypothetical protein [Candidatus Omnitrophota bacterium]
MKITTVLFSEVNAMGTGRVARRHGTCWYFWNCPESIRKECDVFLNMDPDKQKCFNRTGLRPCINDRVDNCSDCAWYKYSREE